MGVVTASGMAAIDLVTNLLSSDELILAPHDCYGGTHRLLTHRALQGRFRTEFVDQGNLAEFEKALALKPSLILVETPSNPLMRLVDIKSICEDWRGDCCQRPRAWRKIGVVGQLYGRHGRTV